MTRDDRVQQAVEIVGLDYPSSEISEEDQHRDRIYRVADALLAAEAEARAAEREACIAAVQAAGWLYGVWHLPGRHHRTRGRTREGGQDMIMTPMQNSWTSECPHCHEIHWNDMRPVIRATVLSVLRLARKIHRSHCASCRTETPCSELDSISSEIERRKEDA